MKAFYFKLIIVFSTFAGYAVYLTFFSTDPFLDRWISGCFAFFVALVVANIVRANTFKGDEAPRDEGEGDPGEPRG